MTITFYWWMYPLTIFIIGMLWANISYRNDSDGDLRGLDAALILFSTLISTISLVIGHFI
jgi:hypothetical protein